MMILTIVILTKFEKVMRQSHLLHDTVTEIYAQAIKLISPWAVINDWFAGILVMLDDLLYHFFYSLQWFSTVFGQWHWGLIYHSITLSQQ